MAEIKCPDCGKEQPDTNKFCKNCGANLENIKTASEEIKIESSEKTIPATENKKICSKCGYELKNEKFCPKCGQSTASVVPYETNEKTCPVCGHKINNGKFCPNCGKDLGSQTIGQESRPQKYCKNCGSQIDLNAEICPKCGVRQMAAKTEKSPAIALVLSFIFPGIGQIYNDQTKKGIYLIVGYIVSWLLIVILIGALLILLIWLYGMYDAYTSAKAINEGKYLEDKLF